MTAADIRDVQRQYVEAAMRARDIGFDIVNVWGGEVATLPVLFLMQMATTST
jgi:2,4-dienoyl-CoA reductase-like NADH-dependent reductase (Old Yellow Enzyme family)